jgi:predicted nicotinamide N-methyase
MECAERSDTPLRARTVELQLPEPAGTLTILEDVHEAGPGGAVWDASVVLAQYLLAQREELALTGARVCELGAGCGVPGIAAAKLGARVTLTDRCVPVCHSAREAHAPA